MATVRVTPRATVQPCVYWPGSGAPLDLLLERGTEITDTDPFVDARGVPSPCRTCSYVETCGGGCAGRRRLLSAFDAPDPLLSGRTRRRPQAQGADGEQPRTSQARKRLHHDRDDALSPAVERNSFATANAHVR
jgi:radical SAM protein with 4Fe4S-binding SPASM domain